MVLQCHCISHIILRKWLYCVLCYSLGNEEIPTVQVLLSTGGQNKRVLSKPLVHVRIRVSIVMFIDAYTCSVAVSLLVSLHAEMPITCNWNLYAFSSQTSWAVKAWSSFASLLFPSVYMMVHCLWSLVPHPQTVLKPASESALLNQFVWPFSVNFFFFFSIYNFFACNFVGAFYLHCVFCAYL